MEEVKVVSLCRSCSACPVVKISADKVVIGEDENICTLTVSEWEILKSKVLSGEL